MKINYLIIVVGSVLLYACNLDDGLFEVIPESDLIALEGMEEAFEHAEIFNDSLQYCSNEPMGCNPDEMGYYDEMFHQYDELFQLHHQNYSHNNVGDDHHHENSSTIRHGWMMNHNESSSGHSNNNEHNDPDEHNNTGEHSYEHNMESFELMMELREAHEDIHPG